LGFTCPSVLMVSTSLTRLLTMSEILPSCLHQRVVRLQPHSPSVPHHLSLQAPTEVWFFCRSTISRCSLTGASSTGFLRQEPPQQGLHPQQVLPYLQPDFAFWCGSSSESSHFIHFINRCHFWMYLWSISAGAASVSSVGAHLFLRRGFA